MGNNGIYDNCLTHTSHKLFISSFASHYVLLFSLLLIQLHYNKDTLLHCRFLVKQLTGARTLPANFYSKLNDSLVSRFSIGSIMEVVDKNRISQVKVGS
jgi:hypothetical protein